MVKGRKSFTSKYPWTSRYMLCRNIYSGIFKVVSIIDLSLLKPDRYLRPHLNNKIRDLARPPTLSNLGGFRYTFDVMAPSALEETSTIEAGSEDTEIAALRKALVSESVPLARRFRALFSLKHYASLQPPTQQSLPAIYAIAAAFHSPSALLKHELAYCLGQTRNMSSVPFLRQVLADRHQDPMCRHEAAEALGALGDNNSLDELRRMRDDNTEATVVRETCEIAVSRIEWEHSAQRRGEKLRDR